MAATDAAMHPHVNVKKELRSLTPSVLSASPYPFQQRSSTTTTTTTTTHLAVAASGPSVGGPLPLPMQSIANPMAFDLDFLDPAAPLSMASGVGATSAAALHAAASHNPLDDLNLLDTQPPLLTLPGDSDGAARMHVVSTAAQFSTTQQHFSDASSVSSAGSPDHPGLSPNTASSFASSPASPNSPLSPQQQLYPSAAAATAAAAALVSAHLQSPWGLAAPTTTLPLPLYPLTAVPAPAVPKGHTIYTPPQPANAAAAKRPTAALSVALPQPAPRTATAATAAVAKPAPATAAKPAPAAAVPLAAPKPKKAELASAAKGRRGGKAKAGGSPSASDEDDVDGADNASNGSGSGDDKRSKRERNKVSAMKYRKRRKVYLDGLESKVQDLNDTVTSLHTENKLLKEQLDFLKNLLRTGGDLPSSPVKFGDASKPAGHIANQPPVLPKIPRPSQMPQHSTLALFCVLACVLLCVTSPDAFFGAFAPGATHSSLSAHPAMAPAPSDVHLHSRGPSRSLLQHASCHCPRPSFSSDAASATPGSDGSGTPVAPTATADSNAQQQNATECVCGDDADGADVDPAAPGLDDAAAADVPPANPPPARTRVTVH